MSRLDPHAKQIRIVPASLYAHCVIAMQTWQRLRAAARIRAERKRITAQLQKTYTTLVDTKARALKSTGVLDTEHADLEAAIVHLAYAIEDYRDLV
jgi:hypothetical protein